MTDSTAVFFIGSVELLMFYWVTYLLGLIFVREALEAYRPRWIFITVGTLIGVVKTVVYTGMFAGLPSKLIFENPWLYVFVVQGIVAGICFVIARPKPEYRGFPVIEQAASRDTP